MHVLQSAFREVESNSTPMMALLVTSLQVLSTAKCLRHRCSSMTDIGSIALVKSNVCTTLYRCPGVQEMHPTRSPCGDMSLSCPTLIWAWLSSLSSAASNTRV